MSVCVCVWWDVHTTCVRFNDNENKLTASIIIVFYFGFICGFNKISSIYWHDRMINILINATYNTQDCINLNMNTQMFNSINIFISDILLIRKAFELYSKDWDQILSVWHHLELSISVHMHKQKLHLAASSKSTISYNTIPIVHGWNRPTRLNPVNQTNPILLWITKCCDKVNISNFVFRSTLEWMIDWICVHFQVNTKRGIGV